MACHYGVGLVHGRSPISLKGRRRKPSVHSMDRIRGQLKDRPR